MKKSFVSYATTDFPSFQVSRLFFRDFFVRDSLTRFICYLLVYSPDMPKRLPLKDIFSVIARCVGTVARFWVQYTLVVIAWLVFIPLTACKYLI